MPSKQGTLADLDEDLDEDLRKMVGMSPVNRWLELNASKMRDIDKDEEGDDGDGSMFEDLDKPPLAPVKRPGKAKSSTKSGPMNWLPAEVDIVHQNRYAMDLAINEGLSSQLLVTGRPEDIQP